MIDIVILCLSVFTFSVLLTWGVRRYALVKNLLDVPNERSSHIVSTPRGGGIAIVFAFLFGVVILWRISSLNTMLVIALTGAGLWVAIIGFIDDHIHVAARWRLLVHFMAASWLMFWLGGLPPLILLGFYIDTGWVGELLAIVALVWLLNLYNFMDGIDGIAGVEAISVSMAAGVIMFLVTNNMQSLILHILMVAAVAGFLVWNLPPAKIFMGDAGSGFVGLMLGALALYSAHIVPQMLWVWLILLGSFIVDASFTLVRRLMQGEKFYRAHRSHAYQYACRKYKSHQIVTFAVLLINFFWLTPWAFAVAFGVIDGVVGILCAYSLLLWLAWYFHAGELEHSQDANI